jgi:hypothetical protein
VTDAAQLVQALRARGVILEPQGDRLRVRPASALSAEELEVLRQVKPEVLRLLAAQPAPTPPPLDPDLPAFLLALPLDHFAREGQPLEVRVPWWPETLWFVPGERDLAALRRQGVAPHRIWTAGELRMLLEGADRTAETLKVVMVLRREFDGEVVAVRPRAALGLEEETRPSRGGEPSP